MNRRHLAFLLLAALGSGCVSQRTLFESPLLVVPASLPVDVEEIRMNGSLSHYSESPLFIVRRRGATVEGVVLALEWVKDSVTAYPPRALAGTDLEHEGMVVEEETGCTHWEKGRLDSTAMYFCRLVRGSGAPSWAEVFHRLDSLASLPVPPVPEPERPPDNFPLGDPRRVERVPAMCSGGIHWTVSVWRNGTLTRRRSLEYGGSCLREDPPYGAYNEAGAAVLLWLDHQVQYRPIPP